MINELPEESVLGGMINRILAVVARFAPGITTWRVRLHRWRGVRIGKDVHIGMRSTIIAHYHGLLPKQEDLRDYVSVRIEDDVSIGAGVIILPNVTIGYGSVVTAGSVVSSSVPPLTLVQGNPARPIARCGIPLSFTTPLKEFYRKLKPLPAGDSTFVSRSGDG